MKLLNKNISVILMVSVLVMCFLIPQNTNAQVPFKISADKPGGGSSSTSSDSGSDDMVYIVAGVALAAIVGYALYKKFTAEEEDDSKSGESSSIQRLLNSEKNSFSNGVQEFREKIPVDLHFGIKNSNTNSTDRTFLVGLSYRF